MAQDRRWSSVAAHLGEEDDVLVSLAPVIERYGQFADFLGNPDDDAAGRAGRAQRANA